MKKIALAGPDISQLEVDYVVDAVKTGWYETYDKHIKLLEKTFTEMTGAKHAIACYCGTHALHLATLSLGLKKGDEVICTDQSYIATAQAISYVGATPVFVDIREDTLAINPDLIEKAITDKTKAIMLVHFAGMAADMDAIMQIADKYHLKVIEDACQIVGGRYKGKYCGTIGDVGCFSFQGAKIAVGGEGGMFVTNSDEIYERAYHYGTFCRNDSISYLWSDDIGYNYRISNITAALILAQLERLPELIAKKKAIYDRYQELFSDIPQIKLLKVNENECDSNYAYVVGFLEDESKITRDEIIEKLLAENIHVRPGYPSMCVQCGYTTKYEVPVSEKFWKKGITFPTALNLTKEDIIRVHDAVYALLY